MTDRSSPTGLMDRENLEQALASSIEAGPEYVAQQIGYVLALAQLANMPSETTPINDPLATLAETRIGALSALKHVLDMKNINRILRDTQQIKHDEVRLSIVLDLATELAPDTRVELMQGLWKQIRELPDPGIRARLLYKLIPLFATELQETTQIASTLMHTIKLAQQMENQEGRVRSQVALAASLPGNMQVDIFNRILDEADQSPNDTLRANAIIAVAERLPSFIEQRIMQSIARVSTPGERVRALTTLARTASQQIQPMIRRETIKGIVQIEDEDERAEALIRFAPHFETADEEEGYTELLEQALGVAVTLSRRNMRARVLVALAPHLTLDLQGEALAAVHSLSSESDRALLLAELAPTLPPNMLVASLAVAHTMREKDSRLQALTSLAHYVPDHARAQTILDALAAANSLPNLYERVTALMGLVDILPPHLLDQAFTDALEATIEIDNESARARALSQLGQYLPPNLIDQALELAHKIEDAQMRLNAYVGIAPRIPEDQRESTLQELLVATRHMHLEYKQARALVTSAPHLTPSLIMEAVEIADGFEDPFDRVSSYVALIQNLPPESRPEVIQPAWELIEKIEDGYDRSSALASIAPYMPDEAGPMLAEKASQVLDSIEDEYDRASAIGILASLLAKGEAVTPDTELDRFTIIQEAFAAVIAIPQQSARLWHLRMGESLWETLDSEERYLLWSSIAEQLTNIPLADVLACLSVLLPIICTFTSEERQKDIALLLGLR